MKITRILRNIYMNTKRHYRRFMFMLTMLSAATFGTAQTSFVPGDGCLNVITPNIGIMASISDEAYFVNAFDTNKNDYKSKLIHDLGISVGLFFQIKGW